MGRHTHPPRFALVFAICAFLLAGAAPSLMGQVVNSNRKLRELDRLPTGLIVEHAPNPVPARKHGPSRRPYTWVFRTTVTAAASDTVTITEFGAFMWTGDHWEFGTITGRPFTPRHFADWYGCPDAHVVPGAVCSDSSNWVGADELHSGRSRWYYIGITSRGQRVKGEAVIEEMAVLDTTGTR